MNKFILLWTVPRTGSNWVREVLVNHPCIFPHTYGMGDLPGIPESIIQAFCEGKICEEELRTYLLNQFGQTCKRKLLFAHIGAGNSYGIREYKIPSQVHIFQADWALDLVMKTSFVSHIISSIRDPMLSLLSFANYRHIYTSKYITECRMLVAQLLILGFNYLRYFKDRIMFVPVDLPTRDNLMRDSVISLELEPQCHFQGVVNSTPKWDVEILDIKEQYEKKDNKIWKSKLFFSFATFLREARIQDWIKSFGYNDLFWFDDNYAGDRNDTIDELTAKSRLVCTNLSSFYPLS